MRCELCGRTFWGNDYIPVKYSRFCFECAIAACDKQLTANKRCRFYPDQPTDCVLCRKFGGALGTEEYTYIGECEYAKENGVKRKEDCENWRVE